MLPGVDGLGPVDAPAGAAPPRPSPADREAAMVYSPSRRRRALPAAEEPRVVGVAEVARVGRLIQRRIYVQGHHPGLGTPITGLTGPETVIELLGIADGRAPSAHG